MTLFAMYHGKRYGYADRWVWIVIEPRFTKLPLWGDERFLRYPIPYLGLSSLSEGLVTVPDPVDSLAKAYLDRGSGSYRGRLIGRYGPG